MLESPSSPVAGELVKALACLAVLWFHHLTLQGVDVNRGVFFLQEAPSSQMANTDQWPVEVLSELGLGRPGQVHW